MIVLPPLRISIFFLVFIFNNSANNFKHKIIKYRILRVPSVRFEKTTEKKYKICCEYSEIISDSFKNYQKLS